MKLIRLNWSLPRHTSFPFFPPSSFPTNLFHLKSKKLRSSHLQSSCFRSQYSKKKKAPFFSFFVWFGEKPENRAVGTWMMTRNFRAEIKREKKGEASWKEFRETNVTSRWRCSLVGRTTDVRTSLFKRDYQETLVNKENVVRGEKKGKETRDQYVNFPILFIYMYWNIVLSSSFGFLRILRRTPPFSCLWRRKQ